MREKILFIKLDLKICCWLLLFLSQFTSTLPQILWQTKSRVFCKYLLSLIIHSVLLLCTVDPTGDGVSLLSFLRILWIIKFQLQQWYFAIYCILIFCHLNSHGNTIYQFLLYISCLQLLHISHRFQPFNAEMNPPYKVWSPAQQLHLLTKVSISTLSFGWRPHVYSEYAHIYHCFGTQVN